MLCVFIPLVAACFQAPPPPDPSEVLLTTAAVRVIEGAHEPPPEPHVHTYSVPWDALAQCESNGNWAINTGNGFYGGLQFNKMSWDWAVAYGGHDVPAWPHEATREQQIAVAETLRKIHPAGIAAWPACSLKLGLRN